MPILISDTKTCVNIHVARVCAVRNYRSMFTVSKCSTGTKLVLSVRSTVYIIASSH